MIAEAKKPSRAGAESEREAALIKAAQAGDASARNELLRGLAPLARYVCLRAIGRRRLRIEIEDAVQIALTIVDEAIDRFDDRHEAPLRVYALAFIERRLISACRVAYGDGLSPAAQGQRAHNRPRVGHPDHEGDEPHPHHSAWDAITATAAVTDWRRQREALDLRIELRDRLRAEFDEHEYWLIYERFFLGRTLEEIGGELGIVKSAVCMRFYRLAKRMRKALADYRPRQAG